MLMLKKALIFLLTIIILLSIITTYKISVMEKITMNKNNSLINQIKLNTFNANYKENKNNKIGQLKINTLNLSEPLFKIHSQENNIEKHVTILKESVFPPNKNSIIFLAAHSGIGKIAYFNKLDKLKENDIIELELNTSSYLYYVKDIWEEKKTGHINVSKETKDQLILTTCSPTKKDYQLIVNCVLKG